MKNQLFSAFCFSQCATSTNIYTFTQNSKKYEVIKELKNWITAASCAAARGGYLVEINSTAEQTAVYNSISSAGVSSTYTTVSSGGGIAYVWIGGTDITTEGTWLWDGDNSGTGLNFWSGQGAAGSGGGSAVSSRYNNWGKSSSGTINEPDDFQNNQDGAGIALASWPYGTAGQWNDIATSFALYYIVEYDCIDTNVIISDSTCGSYLSPSGKTWITSGLYQDTISRIGGCDSTISINLTFSTIDTTMSISGDTLIANHMTGTATYKWLDCGNGYSIVPGATTNKLVPSNSGSYAIVITTLGNCSDTLRCINVNKASINENNDASFSIHPNPSNEYIQINLTLINPKNYIIYNSIGEIVLEGTVKNKSEKVNISSLEKDIYIVKIGNKTQKLIKN
jgi:hypothetical protein